MLDDQLIQELNSTLTAFAHAEFMARCGDGNLAERFKQIAEAFKRTYPDLVARTGATADQIRRMVVYVIRVPGATDPWRVCEYDLAQLQPEDIARLSEPARQNVEHALLLVDREGGPALAEGKRIEDMLRAVLGETMPDTMEKSLEVLCARYQENRAQGVCEEWMDEFERLLAAMAAQHKRTQ